MFCEDDMNAMLTATSVHVSRLVASGDLAGAYRKIAELEAEIDERRFLRLTWASSIEQAGVSPNISEALSRVGIETIGQVMVFLERRKSDKTIKINRVGPKAIRELTQICKGVFTMPQPCNYEGIIDFIDDKGCKILPRNGCRAQIFIKPSTATINQVFISAKLCGCDGASDKVIMEPVEASYEYPYYFAEVRWTSKDAVPGLKCYVDANVIGDGCQETFTRKIQIGSE